MLANEEVVDGKSEVGGFPVVRKPMRQWMLRITAYAERLLAGSRHHRLERFAQGNAAKLDWPQRRRGSGFQIAEHCELPIQIRVFHHAPGHLFGATYMVLSPEHKLGGSKSPRRNRSKRSKNTKPRLPRKSDLERTELAKEKTGVFTGAYAINPVNGEKIPIWIADYVLASYGTGAIMAVPAHDTRDFEFATKFNLPIVQVVAAAGSQNRLARFCRMTARR